MVRTKIKVVYLFVCLFVCLVGWFGFVQLLIYVSESCCILRWPDSANLKSKLKNDESKSQMVNGVVGWWGGGVVG